MARICPECLAVEHPMWTSSWADRRRPFCVQHVSWLRDRCDLCGQTLRLGTVRLTSCPCGYSLRQLRPARMSSAAQRAFIHSELDLGVALWFGAVALFGWAGRPLKKASATAMDDIARIAERGAEVVVDWPESFYLVLDNYRPSAKPGECLLLNRAFPGLMRRVRRPEISGWSARILEAIRVYVGRSANSLNPLLGRNVPGSSSQTVGALARAFGVRYERLVDVLEVLELPTRRTAAGRARRVVSVEATAQLKIRVQGEISIKHAAKLLTMSAPRMTVLCRDRLLTDRQHRLGLYEVEALKTALINTALLTRIPEGAVPWAQALRLVVPISRTSEMVRAVLVGELRTFSDHLPAQLSELSFGRTELHRWCRDVVDRSWISIPEAASMMELKQEVVYHLVSVGLMRSQTAPEMRRGQVVHVTELERFRQQYEPLASVARRAGINHRRALSWSKSAGIELVSGPTVDGGRQYFARIRTAITPRPA